MPIVSPLPKDSAVRTFRPVALVYGAHRRLTIYTTDGITEAKGARRVRAALAQLRRQKMSIYSGGKVADLRHTTGAREWVAHTWRRRVSKLVHEPTGATVYPLRSALSPHPEDAFAELLDVADWLAAYGVRAGSISASASNLYRATLDRELRVSSDPRLGASALYGGRQEAQLRLDGDGTPKVYSSMTSYDIRRAYPTAMGTRPYAASFREVPATTTLDPEVPGLARATVIVPHGLPYAPLPVRVPVPGRRVVSYQWGRLHGVWPWCELAAASQLGCTVLPSRVWAPRRTLDLFGSWLPVALGAEQLARPGARRLAKAIGNATWGLWAMRPSGAGLLRWEDDAGTRPVEVTRTAHYPRGGLHVAAETTARVRRRLLLEGIYGDGDGVPVYADTDGLIVRSTRPCPTPSGDRPGDWRAKDDMRRLQIRAPQLYRFLCGKGCGITHRKWHYVASGVSGDDLAERLFHARRAVSVSYRVDFEPVIQATHSDDPNVAQLALEALSITD